MNYHISIEVRNSYKSAINDYVMDIAYRLIVTKVKDKIICDLMNTVMSAWECSMIRDPTKYACGLSVCNRGQRIHVLKELQK